MSIPFPEQPSTRPAFPAPPVGMPTIPATEANIFGPPIELDPVTITRMAREERINSAKERLKRAIEANNMNTIRRLVEEEPNVLLNVDDHTPTERWQHAFEIAEVTPNVRPGIVQFLRNNTPGNYEELRNTPSWQEPMIRRTAINNENIAQDAVNVFM